MIATQKRGRAAAPPAPLVLPPKEFIPNVPGALDCLYRAARCSRLDQMADQVRRAINHLKEDRE